MINKNIVIVGGGIAGLKLALKLGNNFKKNNFYKIILVDKNMYYVCKPLLHMIAGNSINPFTNIINYKLFSKKNNFEFQLGELINIDAKNKKIILNNEFSRDKSELLIPKRFINYDILTLSIGSDTNDFNIIGVNEYCIKLNNLNDAKLCLEKINNILIKLKFNKNINEVINIIIIGAGSTGVELSSEIANSIKNFNKNSLNLFYNSKVKIILIESENKILPSLSENLSINIHEELKKIGINIILNTKVIKVNKEGVFTNNDCFIKSNLIIWTTGIKINNNIKNINNLELNELNQIIVKQNLLTTKDSSIFAIGDCAYCKNEKGYVIPARAQSANQMSDHVFNNIKLLIDNKNINDFKYIEKGTIINLSKFNTFGSINILFKKNIFIKGFFAKIIYMYLHRSYQITLYGFFRTILIIITENLLKLLNFY